MHDEIQVTSGAKTAGLWRNRSFNIFWAGQGLSSFGDAVAIIAFPLLVLEATGSVVQMGLVTGCFGLGRWVAALFAGGVADRVDRRRLMLWCDLGRACAYGAIPLVWLVAGPRSWVLYGVSALGAVLTTLFEVGHTTAVAALVEREQLTAANGRLSATGAAAFAVGPVLAGLLSERFGPAAVLGIDAISFLCSAASLALVHMRPRAPVSVAARAEAGEVRRLEGLRTGLQYIRGERVLLAVAVLFCLVSTVSAGAQDLFVYHLKHDLTLGSRVVGGIFGAGSIGALVGSLLVPLLRHRLGFGACFLGAIAIEGASALLLGGGAAPGMIGGFVLLFCLARTMTWILYISIRQERTPESLLGRVTAALFTIDLALIPLMAWLTAELVAVTGSLVVFRLMGALLGCIALLGLVTAARERHPAAVALAPAGFSERPEP